MEEKTYSITKLADLLNISDHTLRKYENDFNLKIPRNDMGHRYYTEKEVELFKRILDWKEKGFNKTTINNLLNHSVEALEQKEKAIELVTLDKLTGADLKELMFKQIVDVISEREKELKQEFEETLEKKLELHEQKIREQIRSENQKLMDYIEKQREKKSLWDRIFKK